jgi:hypothetical protein
MKTVATPPWVAALRSAGWCCSIDPVKVVDITVAVVIFSIGLFTRTKLRLVPPQYAAEIAMRKIGPVVDDRNHDSRGPFFIEKIVTRVG